MFNFHTAWKHRKTSGFYVLMGYRNGMLIWNGLMLANRFKCCTSIFNIVCGLWTFHSAEFYLIRAGNKKYIPFVICIHCENFIFSYLNLKTVWETHCLYHDIQSKTNQLPRFLEKNQNLRLVFRLRMAQNFFLQWILLCFI